MFPGLTTKLSEAGVTTTTSIEVKTDIVRLSGTTSVATIKVGRFGGGFSGMCIFVPVDGDVALLTTGNIAVAVTCAQNRATLLVYSKKLNTWYPGAIS